jgi:uncharacterized membrane protein (UPF0136 family)
MSLSPSSSVSSERDSGYPFKTQSQVKKLNLALILLFGPLGAALFFGGPVSFALVIAGGGGLIGYAAVYNSKTHPLAGVIMGIFLSLLPAILLGKVSWGIREGLYKSSTLIAGGALFGGITLISSAVAYYYYKRF